MKISDLSLEDSPSLLDKVGPVFILGCPRSGTTFLSHCIAAIPGIYEFVGVLVPPRMMHLIGSPSSSVLRHELLACARDIFWQAFWRRIYSRSEKLILLYKQSIDLKEFLDKPTIEGKLFCYKEPFLCFAAQYFADYFPNSKFIHIIRDGRDNADSMIRTYNHALSDEILTSTVLTDNKISEIGLWRTVDGFNFPWWIPTEEEQRFKVMSKYGRYVRLWKEMTLLGRDLKQILPKSRYYEVKYEDLVTYPHKYGHEMREFLGFASSNAFTKRLSTASHKSSGISRINQDQKKLSEALEIAGDLLEELNYA